VNVEVAPVTENLQKEQLSRAHLRTIASLAGLNLSLPDVDDDSIDVQVQASGSFHPSSPRLDIQLKSTTIETPVQPAGITWRMRRKNYDDLRRETSTPRILVLLLVPEYKEDWFGQSEEELTIRKAAYWLSLRGMPAVNQATITLMVPRTQLLTPEAIRKLMLDSQWSPES